jgi:hypothetical protein
VRQETESSRQQAARKNRDRLILRELLNLRGLQNKKDEGLRIEDRLIAEWGVLDAKNELACCWRQGLHIGPDLSGPLAK